MNTELRSFFREDTQETSGLFEEVFENAGEAITVFDEDGTYHAFNPAFLKLTGYSPEELLRSDLPAVHALALDHERPMIQECLQEALLTGGPVRYERSFIRKDARPIPTRVTLVRLKKRPSWPKHRLLAVVADISEIKAKESELKRLYDAVEAQQRTIMELSTPIIPVWSRVIMAPLLGSFDSQRMHDLSEKLLQEVASQKPKAALLDLSGLAHVDTQVISEIVGLITSVRILGARTILSGITPHVAQSLVRLGANLDGIPTYATLEQALRSVVGEAVHGGR